MRHILHYAWMDLDTLTLPPYVPGSRQPRFPHTAAVVAKRTVLDANGVPVTYRVRATATDWWVSATVRGFRASAALHTTIELRARGWLLAVQEGRVVIGVAQPTSCAMP